MFDWLKQVGGEGPGLKRIFEHFREMLSNGRHVYALAANAALGGADPEVVREEIFDTDFKINQGEQELRRELIVHASVHGRASFPTCLVLMSISKDAERIGDYGKNLFDLAVRRPLGKADPRFDDIKALKSKIADLLGEMMTVYGSQDREKAKAFLKRAEDLEDQCDAIVDDLLQAESGSAKGAVSAALATRYFKRIAAHAKNVITSVIMPVDKLDFFDER